MPMACPLPTGDWLALAVLPSHLIHIKPKGINLRTLTKKKKRTTNNEQHESERVTLHSSIPTHLMLSCLVLSFHLTCATSSLHVCHVSRSGCFLPGFLPAGSGIHQNKKHKNESTESKKKIPKHPIQSNPIQTKKRGNNVSACIYVRMDALSHECMHRWVERGACDMAS